MIKWFAILGVVSAVGGAGYWVATELIEKGRLEVANETQTETIKSLQDGMNHYVKAIQFMSDDFIKSEAKANEQKKRFNLDGMEKLIKNNPVRAAAVAYSNTDVLFSEIETRRNSFRDRNKAETKMPDKRLPAYIP